MRMRLTLPVVLILVLGVTGCSDTGGGSPASTEAAPASQAAGASQASLPVVLWPAPPNPMELTVAAGLEPAPKEFLTNHAHAHLDIFVDGKPITVPAGIGINTDDPEVRRFDEPDGSVGYGGIELCSSPCISPLHTHDADGILHTESANPEPNTLGQFFTEWGVVLTETCVGEYCEPEPIAIYINGEPFSGDPRTIELTDRKQIAIVIGTPPAEIPSTADFSRV
jgi:hypothetical protein